MTCFHPMKGWKSKSSNQITFIKSKGYEDLPRTVPCGQCVGCRLERSRQWAIRCHHEASLNLENCFITLTYSDENLPPDRSLNVREFQLFMKRLRKQYEPKKIRFYACGEYGDKLARPHYHACLFNHGFSDRTIWQRAKDRDPLYRSAELEELWPFGFSSVGDVTFKSAAYVARYLMKKQNGKPAENHYRYIDADGVVHDRKPEFTVMSRRPGIGTKWLEKYASDVYPDDFIIINGQRMRPPRFYDTNYEISDPKLLARLKLTRKKNLRKHADNNTPARLAVRETIQKKKLDQLVRPIDKPEDRNK